MSNIFIYQDQSFHTGDTVRLHLSVAEGDKTRTQVFEGIVIGVKGTGAGKSILVRKIGANSIGVERLVPLMSPNLTKIELKAPGKVRRAKLYYLRDRIGRQATKVKTKVELKASTKPAAKKTVKKTTSKSSK